MISREEIKHIQNVLSAEFWGKIVSQTEKTYGPDFTIGNLRDVHNEIGGNKHFLAAVHGHNPAKGATNFRYIPDIPSFGDEMPVILKHAPKDLAHIFGTHAANFYGHLPELEGYGLATEHGLYTNDFINFAQKFNDPDNTFQPASPEEIVKGFRLRYNNDSVYVDKDLLSVAKSGEPIIKQEVGANEYAYEYKLIMASFILGAVKNEKMYEQSGKHLHSPEFSISEFENYTFKKTRLSVEDIQLADRVRTQDLRKSDIKPSTEVVLERYTNFKSAIDNSNLVER